MTTEPVLTLLSQLTLDPSGAVGMVVGQSDTAVRITGNLLEVLFTHSALHLEGRVVYCLAGLQVNSPVGDSVRTLRVEIIFLK